MCQGLKKANNSHTIIPDIIIIDSDGDSEEHCKGLPKSTQWEEKLKAYIRIDSDSDMDMHKDLKCTRPFKMEECETIIISDSEDENINASDKLTVSDPGNNISGYAYKEWSSKADIVLKNVFTRIRQAMSERNMNESSDVETYNGCIEPLLHQKDNKTKYFPEKERSTKDGIGEETKEATYKKVRKKAKSEKEIHHIRPPDLSKGNVSPTEGMHIYSDKSSSQEYLNNKQCETDTSEMSGYAIQIDSQENIHCRKGINDDTNITVSLSKDLNMPLGKEVLSYPVKEGMKKSVGESTNSMESQLNTSKGKCTIKKKFFILLTYVFIL